MQAVSEISMQELKRMMGEQPPPFTLVETLPPGNYQEGHLPGAINLPPDRIEDLAEQILPDKDADIVVYCGGGT